MTIQIVSPCTVSHMTSLPDTERCRDCVRLPDQAVTTHAWRRIRSRGCFSVWRVSIVITATPTRRLGLPVAACLRSVRPGRGPRTSDLAADAPWQRPLCLLAHPDGEGTPPCNARRQGFLGSRLPSAPWQSSSCDQLPCTIGRLSPRWAASVIAVAVDGTASAFAPNTLADFNDRTVS